jgi:Mg2+-importing ATPase
VGRGNRSLGHNSKRDSIKPSWAQPITTDEILRLPVSEVLRKFDTSESGLSTKEGEKILRTCGFNEITIRKKRATIVEFLSRFKNPLVLILLAAGLVSTYFGQVIEPSIIFTIVMMSVILDFLQESKASKAAEELKERVATTATVLRDGVKQEIMLSEVVPGDIVFLSTGDIVPADSRVIEAKDAHLDQSALTGESFPVEKTPNPLKSKEISSIIAWDNYLFMGTSVVSGTATAVVVKTGEFTEYGRIAKRLAERRPETEFEKGLRRFGYLIMQVTFILVMFVFFINALYLRGILDSLLFAVALAVGLTPELLPMILSVNLSKGALAMSKEGVIVKRLASIQNFGSMDVLCTDKTGTLTENMVALKSHTDIEGNDNEKVLVYAHLNSEFRTGIKTTLDDAILKHRETGVQGFERIDVVPFDFTRKRVSVIVSHQDELLMITKGAPEEIIKVATRYEIDGKSSDLTRDVQKRIVEKYHALSDKGLRVIAVAYKRISEGKREYTVKDENDLTFLGFCSFTDPPKKTAKQSLRLLEKASIELKILTGDNELVTRTVCEQLGFEIKGVLLGSDIDGMTDEGLAKSAETSNIFARLTPAQKDRIMHVLKSTGHVVGFLGDGINDAPSMKVADVSISVNNAVDIAKETADIILLHKDLTVLAKGVLEGRRTFGNTMKYIQMGVSSNFGNMFSVAGASLFLPFLPMLPIQILLNNLMYDVSELSIPTDNVDKEYIATPKRMDIRYVRDFMLYFGPISSLFDFLTFFTMLFIFSATAALFQTAWFLESLWTQTLVVYIIRTRRSPFFKSRPSKSMIIAGLSVVTVALLIPYTLLGTLFQFVRPPDTFLIVLALIVGSYLILVEALKRRFIRRHAYRVEQSFLVK